MYEEACYYQISEVLGEYESTRQLQKQTKLRKAVRDRLGENYKKFLERFLALIEKKRSEFLEKCFDNHRTHDQEGRTTYVYDKTRRYLNGFDIFVLGKDQASCTHCHDILLLVEVFLNPCLLGLLIMRGQSFVFQRFAFLGHRRNLLWRNSSFKISGE